MTDLDSLRQALQAPLTHNPGGLDIGQIITKGRRARRRRRVFVIGGWSACLTAALLAAVTSGGLARQSPGPHPSVRPAPPATGQCHDGPGTLCGLVIRTTIKNASGWLVLYVVKVGGVPGTTFGVMVTYQKGGKLAPGVETNETNGSDLSPGFHAVESALSVNGQSMPEFGYYVGPAAKIIGVAAGKTLQASMAHWSIDRQVVIFWFPLGLRMVTKLAAYNAAGHRLPTGDHSIHH
ncbi:MAG TPA: hypothetical protein VGS19_09410 [Streptosporangiaceae bacterium]|nr:hypothetical protein [Streptosporangiaceae bacterium]